jgi:hypothetical protein
MMNGYWLTFLDGSRGYCQGVNEYDAKAIAEKLTGKTVAGGQFRDIAAKRLPYPATPVIWQLDHPVNEGRTPPFWLRAQSMRRQKFMSTNPCLL